MSEDRARLIRDALHAPPTVIPYVLSEAVARAWPDRTVLETSDYSFGVDVFLERVECAVEVHRSPHPQHETQWRGPGKGLEWGLIEGHRTVVWEGETFDLVEASWNDGQRHHARTFFVGRSEASVRRFAERVAEVANEIRGEVLVFANGCWQRSKELRAAIADTTFDNLVLPSGQAEEIRADFEQFLGAREDYERYHVPWKRGVLFLGPPGNGKTHCVKALLNALSLPCLYVQSFEAPYTNPQNNVHQVFRRARRTTPCALVLEDLDALVSDKTRSFFLNELDGFASNAGILTVATTNHAERLDPAIIDRPSRFDRKYTFDLPAEPERTAYLAMWNRTLDPEARLQDAAIADLAAHTDGFSYAYVKELMLSSLVRWMSDGRTVALADVARGQVDALRRQMATAAAQAEHRLAYVREWPDMDAPWPRPPR